jgi:hypothetical protein
VTVSHCYSCGQAREPAKPPKRSGVFVDLAPRELDALYKLVKERRITVRAFVQSCVARATTFRGLTDEPKTEMDVGQSSRLAGIAFDAFMREKNLDIPSALEPHRAEARVMLANRIVDATLDRFKGLERRLFPLIDEWIDMRHELENAVDFVSLLTLALFDRPRNAIAIERLQNSFDHSVESDDDSPF